MFEQLKTEAATAGGPQSRIGVMIGALLVLGAVIFGVATFSGKKGPERLPGAQDPREVEAVVEAAIDTSRLPAEDDASVHGQYQADGVAYLREVVDQDLSRLALRMSPEAIQAIPFAEARGEVFEVQGGIEALVQEAWGPNDKERLWSVLIEGADGGRVIVLRHSLGSDHEGGRPDDAFRDATDYLEVGDRVLARGVYLQRRTGTFGTAIVREPVPVLMATPPAMAFRKLPRPAVAVDHPLEADWDDIKDRYIGETQHWQEPALFQVIQWARAYGHDRIVADIRSGKLKVEYWGKDVFDQWGEEVENEDSSAPRPFTESLRGRVFKTTGLIGSFQRESWATMPRISSAWDIDTLYLLDLVSDHWGNRAIRSWSAFPLETYGQVKGDKWEHVAAYGFFLKNHTYKTRQLRDGTSADHTMPMFIVIHMEPLPIETPPYGTLMWFIGGTLVLLGVVSYFVLGHGAKKEEERLHAQRIARRRARTGGMPLNPKGGEGGEPGGDSDGDSDGESGAGPGGASESSEGA